MRTIIQFLFCLFLISAKAQNQNPTFINYSIKDGLSDNAVNSITQDSRGFIWAATENGINRFDGVEFKKYFPTELIGNLKVTDKTSLYFEIKPNLILARLGNQKGYTFNTVQQKLEIIPALKNVICGNFTFLDKTKFATSCADSALILSTDLKIVDIIKPPLKHKNSFVSLLKISDDSYFVYTNLEFFFYRKSTRKFTEFFPKINLDADYQKGFEVLYIDKKTNSIFFSNYFKGLYKLNFDGKILQNWTNGISAHKITSFPTKILMDPRNDSLAWLCGGSGVSKLNIYTNQAVLFKPDLSNSLALQSAYSSNLFFDKNFNLWVSTPTGIGRQNNFSSSITTWNLNTGSDYPLMNIIQTKDKKMYASAYFMGVYENEIKPNQTNTFNQIGAQKLKGSWFIFEDGETIVQGGETTTLNYYNRKTKKITQSDFLKKYFKNSTIVVLGYKAKNGDLWYSGNAGGGLVRVAASGKITHFSKALKSFSGSYFITCKEQPNGDIWFGSNKSSILLHWINSSSKFEEVNFQKKFEKINSYQSGINCLEVVDNQIIWIGFDGSGLVKYNTKNDKFTLLTNRLGLPSNIINNLVRDGKNRLWVSTRNGLACILANEEKIYTFNLKNGFPTESFETSCSFYDEPNNELWIASSELLLRFNPDKLIAKKNQKFQIFIDEFLVNNKSQNLSQSINFVFKPSENNVQFSFSSLNFQGGNEIVYSYQLLGTQDDWIDCRNNKHTSIINLPHGDYEFRLRAKQIGDTHWTYLESPIKFTINTPWYKSWWFVLICIFGTLFILYVLIRSYFVRKLEKQNVIIERQKAVQLERDRIAHDMHDDLGSGLTKISYLSNMALQKTDKTDELTKIKRTSLELVENMSELIWAMKVENDSLQDLINFMKLNAYEYLEFNNLELKMNIPNEIEDRIISGDARRSIFLLFKESLHNIVKHAQATSVEINFEIDDSFKFKIKDNGIGFDFESLDLSKGNGLRNMEKRVQKLNGSSKVESKNGTELSFDFPLDHLK